MNERPAGGSLSERQTGLVFERRAQDQTRHPLRGTAPPRVKPISAFSTFAELLNVADKSTSRTGLLGRQQTANGWNEVVANRLRQ